MQVMSDSVIIMTDSVILLLCDVTLANSVLTMYPKSRDIKCSVTICQLKKFRSEFLPQSLDINCRVTSR